MNPPTPAPGAEQHAALSDAAFLLDKTGREILVGDVLKIFHFVHRVRREKCFMYKLVVAREMLGTTKQVPAFKISHLEPKDGQLTEGGYYRELLDCRQLTGVEIVQGYGPNGGDCYRDRPKRATPTSREERR